MSERGILYIVWGKADGPLQRSIESVRRWHPELPIYVERLPEGSTLLDKAKMCDLSPFKETLFLDADTVVLGRLDFGFNQAFHFGLACCICECPWAQRYTGWKGEAVEYNTGVLFWSERGMSVMQAWRDLAPTMPSAMTWSDGQKLTTMPLNDQASFAQAVRQTRKNPFVLPMNYNLRPRWQRNWFGPVKVWHDYKNPPPMLMDAGTTLPPMMFCELGE